MMARIPFSKLVGAGNDFVVVDARSRRIKAPKNQWPALARAWCDRRLGIGADGVLVLGPSKKADVVMRVFNPDGSEAEMCGNGARCVALYQAQAKHRAAGRNGHVSIETKAGLLSATVKGGRVSMRMTDPIGLYPSFSLEVEGRQTQMGFVNTGVPHAVVPVDGLALVDVNRLGRLIRNHPHFSPNGTNVNFIRRDSDNPDHIAIRTYERGVEGETLACGTGIAASAILHAVWQMQGLAQQRTIAVDAKSGDRLQVSMTLNRTGSDIQVSDVFMEGPARQVFDGVADWPHHLSVAAHRRKPKR